MTSSNQAKLGILMLETQFPRINGDIGNPKTWPFPVEYAVVPGATPRAIVCDDTSAFVEAFVAQGQQLVANGCTGIATSCGFLALIRGQLATRLGVPVASSALEQAAQINAMLTPDQTLGILTISEASLSPAHLSAADVPQNVIVAGVEETHFGQTILNDAPKLDIETARHELVDAAKTLKERCPDLGAILLECTNMPPYAQDIMIATGVPVFSTVTYLKWFHAGLRPEVFTQP